MFRDSNIDWHTVRLADAVEIRYLQPNVDKLKYRDVKHYAVPYCYPVSINISLTGSDFVTDAVHLAITDHYCINYSDAKPIRDGITISNRKPLRYWQSGYNIVADQYPEPQRDCVAYYHSDAEPDKHDE